MACSFVQCAVPALPSDGAAQSTETVALLQRGGIALLMAVIWKAGMTFSQEQRYSQCTRGGLLCTHVLGLAL